MAPFLILHGMLALVGSLALSGVALVAIGAATSLFTGRGFAISAARQLVIGYAAAAVTFGIGRLVGVAIS